MVMKTSLIITGDASVAKREVESLAAAVSKTAADAKAAAPAVQQLDKALDATAASAKEAAAATAAGEKAQTAATIAAAAAAGAARELAQSLAQTAAAQANVTTIMKENAAAQSAQAAVIQAIVAEGQQLASVFALLSQAGADSAAQIRLVGASAAQATAGTAALEAEARKAANAEAALDAAARRVLQAVDEEALAVLRLNDLLEDAKLALDGARISEEQYERVKRLATKTGADHARTLGQQKAGMVSLGQQVQDVGIQLSMGTDIMRVMAMQGGQLATAIDMIGVKGAGGRAAAFFAGPWGAVILTATAILGPMVAKLSEQDAAQGKATKSGMTLADALDRQRFATGAAREAIAAYNEQQEKSRKETELATRQSLANAEADIKAAIATREKTKAKLADRQAEEQAAITGPGIGSMGGNAVAANAAAVRAQAIADRLKGQDQAIAGLEQTRRNLLVQVGGKNGEAAADPIRAIDLRYDLQRQQAEDQAKSNTRLARSIDKTVEAIERRRAAEKKEEEERQRRADSRDRPRTVSLGNQVEATSAAAILASAERYRGLNENRAGDRATLRDLFSQANVTVDPQMTAWCAAFVNAVLATNGITGTGSLSARSFLGFGENTDTPNKGDIVVSRRGDNAAQGHVGFYQGSDAKGRVLVLGGNTGDRVGTQAIDRGDVLGFRRAPSAADAYATAQKAAADAAKEQARDLDQIVAKYLPLNAAARDYADELARIDGLAKSYDGKNPTSGLTAEQATAARAALKAANDRRVAEIDLTPEAKAAADAKTSIDGVVASLGQELAARQALDPVTRAMAKHQEELNALSGDARVKAEAELRAGYEKAEAYGAIEKATRAAADAQRALRDMALDAFDAIAIGGENAGKVLERLAQRIASAAVEATIMGTGPLAGLLRGATLAPNAGAGGTAAAVASKAAGQAAADLVGKSVGKSVGDRLDRLFGSGNAAKILQNGGLGYAAAGFTGGNALGGAVGGAVGGQVASQFLSQALGSAAGPLGAIAGGILGGMVGNMFAKKKYGTAAITTNDASVVAEGNSGSASRAASGLANAVQDGIAAIVDKLGGSLGEYAVSIGTYKDKFRVSTTGFDGRLGNQGNLTSTLGIVDFGKDGQTEAIAFAIRDAIADGAVKGLSEKVQRALQSNTDVNKAVAEAVKVQALEELMGGISGSIDKAFRTFDNTARERVRLAQKYGFDLVAIEKRNGEDRAKLAKQLAEQQVGSLQKLIDEMTAGSMFEGSAIDKLAAIETSLAKARADVAAGVDGAGDVLADLLAKKVATSRDAYGTTGSYAADRTATIDEARAAVAAANARILAAQNKPTSDPALTRTNEALDENNDQNAEMIDALRLNNQLLQGFLQLDRGGGFNLSQMSIY